MKKKANQSKTKATDQPSAKPAAQIDDLPPTSEQTEQAKGGILVGMLLPNVQKVREAAAR